MRVPATFVFLAISTAAQANQFSLRCDDGPYDPLIFTFDTAAQKAIYESPVREGPLPGTITRSIGKSFLFSVQGIGPDFTDFVWDNSASQMQIGLRGSGRSPRSSRRSGRNLDLAHDLVRKPVPTFRDHALTAHAKAILPHLDPAMVAG
jgi:hypothetical protein